MPAPAPPNDPKAQARAAKLHPPDATTDAPVTGRESIAGRMSPAAQLLGGLNPIARQALAPTYWDDAGFVTLFRGHPLASSQTGGTQLHRPDLHPLRERRIAC